MPKPKADGGRIPAVGVDGHSLRERLPVIYYRRSEPFSPVSLFAAAPQQLLSGEQRKPSGFDPAGWIMNRKVETAYMKKNRYFRCAAVLCATSVGAFLVSRQATFAAAPAKPLSSFDPQAKALLAR